MVLQAKNPFVDREIVYSIAGALRSTVRLPMEGTHTNVSPLSTRLKPSCACARSADLSRMRGEGHCIAFVHGNFMVRLAQDRDPQARRMLRVASSFIACCLMMAAVSTHPARAQGPAVEPVSMRRASAPVLVVGFMGGRIKADNMVHQEAVIAQDLQRLDRGVTVRTFANHDRVPALDAVLNFVDTNHDHVISPEEKRAAHVIIYGHSWGASETVNLARTLNRMGIPVLLTHPG